MNTENRTLRKDSPAGCSEERRPGSCTIQKFKKQKNTDEQNYNGSGMISRIMLDYFFVLWETGRVQCGLLRSPESVAGKTLREVKIVKIGDREFDTEHHTYVMGILNVTPDSFSDGGKYDRLDAALFHAQEMIGEGADLLDVGGESTRPGYTPVSAEEEIARTAPVLEALKARFDIPLSLDTCKSEVAEAGFQAGADLLNDIWGLRRDEKMAGTAAKWGKPCCLMHNRDEAVYEDFLPEMKDDLLKSVRLARAAGIAEDQIILDPGIGFGKTYEQNLSAMKHLEDFCALGYPVLLGASKKSVIGLTLDVPAGQRGAGTIASTVLAVMKGCAFVRVHDVKENVQAVRMTEAVLEAE